MNFIKQKPGLFICICSLLFLFLLNLPLNLSVSCANENQGLAFTWGQALLRWHDLTYGRGLLYVLLNAIVLKIFGFNTWAIVGIHILETIILISIGVLLYLIVRKILKSDIYGAISVLFWIIFICTPIGKSGLVVEIASHYNLDEECLCVLFSLCSILCFLLSNFFENNQVSNPNIKEKIYSFLAGLFAVCSLMSKGNGAILCIAIIVWLLQVYLFQREYFKSLKTHFVYCFLGIILSLSFFNFILYKLHGDLFLSWKNYFFVGNYSHNYLMSWRVFLKTIYMFMTRYTNSMSNFVLFFFAFLLFGIGLFNGCFKRNAQNPLAMFWSLISIWSFGNACVIMVPGDYQPYYYHLIWPSLAIVFVIGLHELFVLLKGKKIVISFISALVVIFFINRIYLSLPSHYHLARALNVLSVFNQPQSFQDPVLPYKTSHFRPYQFLLADAINIHLPDKNSTFYVLTFSERGLTAFTPLTYIYSKRASPTTVDAGLLAVPTIIEMKLKVLKRDLSIRKPNILIVPKNISLQPWQVEYLPPFLEWVKDLIRNNYRFENFFELAVKGRQSETFLVYRKIKK